MFRGVFFFILVGFILMSPEESLIYLTLQVTQLKVEINSNSLKCLTECPGLRKYECLKAIKRYADLSRMNCETLFNGALNIYEIFSISMQRNVLWRGWKTNRSLYTYSVFDYFICLERNFKGPWTFDLANEYGVTQKLYHIE